MLSWIMFTAFLHAICYSTAYFIFDVLFNATFSTKIATIIRIVTIDANEFVQRSWYFLRGRVGRRLRQGPLSQ